MKRMIKPRKKVVRQRKTFNKHDIAAQYGEEPEFEGEYDPKMAGQALCWYSAVIHDNKIMKKWFLTSITDKHIKQKLGLVHESFFGCVGTFARMQARGLVLDEINQKSFEKFSTELIAMSGGYEPDEPVIKKESTKFLTIGAELEHEIDKFLVDGCQTKFLPTEYIDSCSLNIADRAKLRTHFKPAIEELDILINEPDVQLKEAYLFLSRPQQKKYREFVHSIINSTIAGPKPGQPRAARTPKSIPPETRVSKMKYKKDDPELKLKSIKPVDILRSKTLWVWHSQGRRIIRYESQIGFDVSGSTLQNVSGSQTKTVRKPEDLFLKTPFLGASSKMDKRFDELKTKAGESSPRLNDQIVLLKVF